MKCSTLILENFHSLVVPGNVSNICAMKEVIVSPTLPEVSARVQDGPVPSFGADEILVKVVVAASNPKGM